MTDLCAVLGLLVVRDFLPEDARERLLAHAGAASGRPAPLRDVGGRLDPAAPTLLDVADDVRADVLERLLRLRSRVGEHFGVALDGCLRPEFLAYGPGGRMDKHTDLSASPRAPDDVRQRRISAVAFFDGQDGSYAGGALVFYGLLAGDQAGYGLPLRGEPGLLVAFPSHLPHAVEPVTAGCRHTVVGWYR